MAEIDWFPRAINKPIPVKSVIAGCLGTWSQGINPWIDANKPAATLCKLSYGYKIARENPAPVLNGKFGDLSKKLKQGQSIADLTGSYGHGNQRLDANKPSPTLVKTAIFGTPKMIHPIEDRGLSIGEAKRIGSFPDEFILRDKYEVAWSQIGNSVPPLFMFAIANRVRQLFLDGQSKAFMSNRYLDLLDEAWQAHLAPREPDAPTFISLFAGCGGSSLGYSMAGYRELLAVEWDDNAVATFKLNFPDVPVYHGDIHKLTVEQCLEMTGLQPGKLDLLDGSPPCQGFSTAGKRQMNDKRNQLYMEYVRLLRGLQPKVFVMENVSGLVKGKMKLIFADIMKELKASGYQVRCKLLNAMYFNVPQSRERLIWIGVREDLETKLVYPQPKTSIITVSKATLHHSEYKRPPEWRKFNLDLWQKQRPGQNGLNGQYFNHCRLHPHRPSPTVPKSCVFGGFSGLYHWSEPRSLNLGELRRLCSFPDGFDLIGTFEDGLNRIGNSVPPLFMRAIAEHIKDTIMTKQ